MCIKWWYVFDLFIQNGLRQVSFSNLCYFYLIIVTRGTVGFTLEIYGWFEGSFSWHLGTSLLTKTRLGTVSVLYSIWTLKSNVVFRFFVSF